MYSLSIRYKLYSWAYFALVIIIGLLLYKDYGLTWDEPVQRGIGLAAYKYIHAGDRAYMEMYDKIYGVGFELPLIYLEKLFNLTDTREIFQFRHLINILFFSFTCFIFFRLNLKLFKKAHLAIIPTLILLRTPRIFAHAFFNSKDLPFLCMYIIGYYALFNYLLKSSYKNLIVLGLCAGLLINFRIMGILFFGTAFFTIVLYLLQKQKLRFGIHSLIFILVACCSLYATWPYLWEEPIKNFQQSWLLMSKFPWLGIMLFRGQVINPGEQLTNYLFTWIGITVPLLYLVMGFMGGTIFLFKVAQNPLKIFENPIKIMGFIFLLNAAAPIVAVLYLKSILYDDWRQLYFIYPACIVFIGYLFYYLNSWKPKLAKISGILCLVYFGYILVQMIQLHPYQQVYFNETVSKKEFYIYNHYDQDYWGASFYEALSYIVQTDQADTIPVFVFHDALIRNALLLLEKDRKRFIFSRNMTEKRAKYYITNFRFDYPDLIGTYHFKHIYYEIKRQNSTLLRVWSH